jgi:hypothetical protein
MTSFGVRQVLTNSDISEGWVVKCTCGVTSDDGRDMIECDTCKTWQHVKCVLGKKKAKALPPGQEFLCTFCRALDDDAPHSKPSQAWSTCRFILSWETHGSAIG